MSVNAFEFPVCFARTSTDGKFTLGFPLSPPHHDGTHFLACGDVAMRDLSREDLASLRDLINRVLEDPAGSGAGGAAPTPQPL